MDAAVINKDQSLALVKIFLNASLACICHTRELIDWESACFRKRYVDQISLEVDSIYESFCSSDARNSGNSQEIRVLTRGYDHRADALLDMIVCCPSLVVANANIAAGTWRLLCNRGCVLGRASSLHHYSGRQITKYTGDLHL
jgi:hypothetical protein